MPIAMANNNDTKTYNDIITKFTDITKKPETFLRSQPQKCNKIQNMLLKMYGLAVSGDAAIQVTSAEVLPELYVDGLDEEQIWQQLELRNEFVIPKFIEKTARLFSIKEQKLEIRLKEEGGEDEEGNSDEENDDDADNELKNMYEEEGDQALSNDEEDDEDDDDDDDDIDMTLFKKQPKKKYRPTVVDDKFFKLNEMADFLDAEDAKEERKQKGKAQITDNDGIDYFADDLGEAEDEEEDSENDNLNYKDFFDEDDDENTDASVVNNKKLDKNNKQQKDHFADDSDEEDVENDEDVEGENKDEDGEDEDDDSEEDDVDEEIDAGASEEIIDKNGKHMEPASNTDSDSEQSNVDENEERLKSAFEERQERLLQRIHDYEEEVLGEKPWQLKGEIQATNRPQNSLLEEILEFESTMRPAPVITEKTTQRLEDIIRQRIKDQAWDDVEPVAPPSQAPQDYRKLLVLDQEKSKESLAQIYEKEYQKEIDKLDPNRDDATEEEPKEHKQIRERMTKLFLQLDALSNFVFTPKPVAPEPKIITNTPAINMEEVAPVAVSDANLLAPEEIYRGPKHELIGKTERDRTDKKRERRKKKQKQRAINKILEKKDLERQKLGIPLSKKHETAKILKNITKHRNVEKMTVSNDHAALKSSKAFFNKLQDTTTSATATKKATKKKADSNQISAKKLKL